MDRLGAENVSSDSLSRFFCATVYLGWIWMNSIICHVTQGSPECSTLWKARIEFNWGCEKMTKARICAEHKLQFNLPVQAHMIKATQPFERLNVDFKRPLQAQQSKHFVPQRLLMSIVISRGGPIQGCWCMHLVFLEAYPVWPLGAFAIPFPHDPGGLYWSTDVKFCTIMQPPGMYWRPDV